MRTCALQHVVYSLDHHRARGLFASCGTLLELWDAERTEPLRAIDCAHDTCTRVRFSPLEVRASLLPIACACPARFYFCPPAACL